MSIVRKIRLSDNMQNIRELFVVYYFTCVIRFSSKSYIRNSSSMKRKHLVINTEIHIIQVIIASRAYFYSLTLALESII
jgi:hypothetical protein